MPKVEGPDANFCHLKWVEDVHGNGVRALVGKVPTYPCAETLEGLTDVDRLAIVIVKRIDAVLGTPDALTISVRLPQEGLNLAADSRDIAGLAFRRYRDTSGYGKRRSGRCGVGFWFLGLGHGRQSQVG